MCDHFDFHAKNSSSTEFLTIFVSRQLSQFYKFNGCQKYKEHVTFSSYTLKKGVLIVIRFTENTILRKYLSLACGCYMQIRFVSF